MYCADISGIAASEVELGGISRDGVIIEHRLLIMIARVGEGVDRAIVLKASSQTLPRLGCVFRFRI